MYYEYKGMQYMDYTKYAFPSDKYSIIKNHY